MKRLTMQGIVAVLAALALLVMLGPAAAGKNGSHDFSGSMSGHFVPAGGDLDEGQFYVLESAVGSIEIEEDSPLLERLGAASFSYAAVFIYDHRVLPMPFPDECHPTLSSSADYGHGTMFFGEGDLRLKLKSGFSCFFVGKEGPMVAVNAAYMIVGGTGPFKYARGSLRVWVDGTIVSGNEPNTMTVQFEGRVRRISDGDDDDDDD